MQDEELITRLCDTIDTLSRGGAIEAIRIVREHDRRVEVERKREWPGHGVQSEYAPAQFTGEGKDR